MKIGGSGASLWTPRRVWTEGLRIGLRTLLSRPVLAGKRFVLPSSYWRSAEFAYVLNALSSVVCDRVVDVGSPKDLASIVAVRFKSQVIACDILQRPVREMHEFAQAQGLQSTTGIGVEAQVHDARCLGFAPEVYDAAFSVSVLEHIPGSGDSEAIRELARVLESGGTLVITVPFAQAYHETWVDRSVYERPQVGDEKVFFERHYDRDTLETRLISPSGCEVADIQIWGEPCISIESILSKLGSGRLLLSPVEGLLAEAFLREVDPHSDSAKAAFLTLTKP